MAQLFAFGGLVAVARDTQLRGGVIPIIFLSTLVSALVASALLFCVVSFWRSSVRWKRDGRGMEAILSQNFTFIAYVVEP